ncbi:MAG: hypothetical protein PUE04_03435 [Lachnospira sp.]|nr:hypothetical protein [Lachnospira sp.]
MKGDEEGERGEDGELADGGKKIHKKGPGWCSEDEPMRGREEMGRFSKEMGGAVKRGVVK